MDILMRLAVFCHFFRLQCSVFTLIWVMLGNFMDWHPVGVRMEYIQIPIARLHYTLYPAHSAHHT